MCLLRCSQGKLEQFFPQTHATSLDFFSDKKKSNSHKHLGGTVPGGDGGQKLILVSWGDHMSYGEAKNMFKKKPEILELSCSCVLYS